jgi:tetratricopeptide (TPR) repeat protein
VHARTGRPDEAAAALSGLDALPFDINWPFAMSLLAQTCVLLGDAETARELYARMLPWGAVNASDLTESMRGAMARYLGLLAGLLGRDAEAARHFEAALAMNARMGARPWLACTRLDYGRLLEARGEDERGRELIAAAFDDFRELGMDSRAYRASETSVPSVQSSASP